MVTGHPHQADVSGNTPPPKSGSRGRQSSPNNPPRNFNLFSALPTTLASPLLRSYRGGVKRLKAYTITAPPRSHWVKVGRRRHGKRHEERFCEGVEACAQAGELEAQKGLGEGVHSLGRGEDGGRKEERLWQRTWQHSSAPRAASGRTADWLSGIFVAGGAPILSVSHPKTSQSIQPTFDWV
ncbi:hypothetical protein R3P38DRAFT_3370335 [Favolaschia claudopus]|uniref:Uncharacterized protein n=1 Tax=Favolaschia claudopus TaxID=2862362 RepID=A0AAW0A1W2_9AGAR